MLTTEVEEVCELVSGNVSSLTLALTQRTVATNLDNVRTDLSSTDVRIFVTLCTRLGVSASVNIVTLYSFLVLVAISLHDIQD